MSRMTAYHEANADSTNKAPHARASSQTSASAEPAEVAEVFAEQHVGVEHDRVPFRLRQVRLRPVAIARHGSAQDRPRFGFHRSAMPRRAHAQSLFNSLIYIADRQRRHCDLFQLRADMNASPPNASAVACAPLEVIRATAQSTRSSLVVSLHYPANAVISSRASGSVSNRLIAASSPSKLASDSGCTALRAQSRNLVSS